MVYIGVWCTQKKLWSKLKQEHVRTWLIHTGVHASQLVAATITARTKSTCAAEGAGTISAVGAPETVKRIYFLQYPSSIKCIYACSYHYIHTIEVRLTAPIHSDPGVCLSHLCCA